MKSEKHVKFSVVYTVNNWNVALKGTNVLQKDFHKFMMNMQRKGNMITLK